MTDLDELMQLHDAATPGPWWSNYQPDDNMIEGELCQWVMGLSDDECPFLDAVEKTCGIPATEGFFCPKVVSISEEDLDYIVAACNAVPELVQRIRELESQCDWLAQAAANAGWHGVRVGKEYMIDQARIAVSRAQAE